MTTHRTILHTKVKHPDPLWPFTCTDCSRTLRARQRDILVSLIVQESKFSRNYLELYVKLYKIWSKRGLNRINQNTNVISNSFYEKFYDIYDVFVFLLLLENSIDQKTKQNKNLACLHYWSSILFINEYRWQKISPFLI